jgi:uncharacterized coiled-coil protein SlyX
MISTKNTTFDYLQTMFTEAENSSDYTVVNKIKADLQDWFMGSASRNVDLQVAYIQNPEMFEKIWEFALSGPVHTFDEYLMWLFPDKRELFVANSDVEKLMKERNELEKKVSYQEALIESYEEDISNNIKKIQSKSDEIISLNTHLGEADEEINSLNNEISKLNTEITRLKSMMFDLIEGEKK